MFQTIARAVARFVRSVRVGDAKLGDSTLFQSPRKVNGVEVALADMWPAIVGDVSVPDDVAHKLDSALVLAALHAALIVPADSIFALAYLGEVLATDEGREVAQAVYRAEVATRYGESRDGRVIAFVGESPDWAAFGATCKAMIDHLHTIAGASVPEQVQAAQADVATDALDALTF